ncbi:MAG TPA: DNA recombination protein RmuC, partial [Acidimicrobiales bacterium]|nr:DNA recombination protein RmuC [Acidimicrobiales bacterium]
GGDGLAAARLEVARLEAALDEQRRAEAERAVSAEETRRQLAGEFAELSIKALEQNSERFLELADCRLKEASVAATGDLDSRKQAIEQLLVPLREQLGRYEEGLRLLELDRQRAYSGLHEQVRALGESQEKLQAETRNLVTALRAPATRGRWGEMQLRRVVEMAGMVEHCDFAEQVSVEADEGRLRPDLVVRLPGAKQVVVDAKVPLQAFLDAGDATDEDGRKAHLAAHARHLRAHVDALAKKEYWRQFDDSPAFVVAFVPGDPLLAAALEQDPSLLEHAVANHVLLATPTTLIALLRSVAYGWQQEALTENAREVQRMGRDLYRRIATFAEHLTRAGKGLNTAVDAYNKAVGSLERTVLPQARRFQELGLVGAADKELVHLDPLDAAPRELQAPELVPGRPALSAVPSPGDGEGAVEPADAQDPGFGQPPAAAR